MPPAAGCGEGRPDQGSSRVLLALLRIGFSGQGLICTAFRGLWQVRQLLVQAAGEKAGLIRVPLGYSWGGYYGYDGGYDP